MGKSIIIAEKPSVGMEYARILGVSDKKNGYLESERWIVTWTVGHLITMSYPEKYDESLKEWSLNTLPFLPESYKYEVIKEVKNQFGIVKGLYNREDIDTIYYAGDSGREGLYIQMLVRQFAGHTRGIKEKVVWIDSQTEEEVLRGISEAKDISDSKYKNLTDAGYMRAIEDYVLGINFSRALSVKYAAMVNTGTNQKKKKPISVGRVMSCVLGMIVDRDREIRNFKETLFYRVTGTFEVHGQSLNCEWKLTDKSRYYNTPDVYSDFGFNDENKAREMISGLENIFTISDIEKKKRKKNPPLLFNLAELQSECSKIYHISPSETLSIAQSLYEKKLTTYPRTDARVITNAILKEITRNLEGIGKNPEYSDFINEIRECHYMIGSKFVDDSQVTDHYAIIPTGVSASDKQLTEQEKRIYNLICCRFIASFYPGAEYEEIVYECTTGSETFYGKGKYLVDKGYMHVLGVPENEVMLDEKQIMTLSNIIIGEQFECEYGIKNGKTMPPSRYTMGSIILAMENAGKYVEDEELREHIKKNGIGTSATRSDVINKLLALNYISADKKLVLTPGSMGEMIYEIISLTVPELLNPEMTAKWEKDLSAIADGTLEKDRYLENLYSFIRDGIKKIKDNLDDKTVMSRIRPFANGQIYKEYKKFDNWNTKLKCPLCGDDIETTEWGFKCKSNKNKTQGCQFFMGGTIKGHRLLTKELATLFSSGKVGPLYDFVSDNGVPFGANLIWDNHSKRISFEIVNLPWKKTEYRCPGCGGAIVVQNGIYKCVNNKGKGIEDSCKFFIGKVAGKTIPDKEIGELCKNKKTGLIRGFKNSDKKLFDAFLVWNKEKKKVDFQFPSATDQATKLRCPLCQGRILHTPYGYSCEDKNCNFFAGKILGHAIKETELQTILSGKKTDLITFKNQDKKNFLASLYWDSENKKISFDFEKTKAVESNLNCPKCGAKLLKSPYGVKCSDDMGNNCDFRIGRIAGVMLDDNQIRKLVTTGKTDLVEGFKSKNKKSFAAYLVWNKAKGNIEFEFPEYKRNVSKYVCPICRDKHLYETEKSFYCECGFNLPKTICEKTLEESDIQKLIHVGETGTISGFYSAKRRGYFSAKLKLIDNKVSFAFDEKKEM